MAKRSGVGPNGCPLARKNNQSYLIGEISDAMVVAHRGTDEGEAEANRPREISGTVFIVDFGN